MANSEEMLKELVYQTMTKIDHRILFERQCDLKVIASDPIISSRDSTPQQITERLIEYRDICKTYISLSFFDQNQIRIADTAGLGIGKKNYNYQYVNDVLQGKMSAGSDVELSINLKVPVIFFASPVKDKNNRTFGVVVTRVPVHKLYEIMQEISFAPHVSNNIKIDLTNSDGLLIYSNYNHKGILKEKPSDWEEVKRSLSESKSGVIKAHTHKGGKENIGAFSVSRGYLDFEGNGWVLVLQMPTSMIYGPIRGLAYKWFFIILPGVILAIIFSIFFAYKLSKPLSNLKNVVTSFGEGNMDLRVHVESSNEIGVLGNSFNLMADNLKKMTKDLQIAEERLRLATEGANLGVWHYNLITGELIFSDRCKSIFGIPSNETVSYERFLESLHPDDREEANKAVLYAIKNHTKYEAEYRSVWADNSIHWISARGLAYYDSTRNAERMEGVVIDIDNLKKTEEELRRAFLYSRDLIESSLDPLFTISQDGKIMDVNNETEVVTGFSRNQLVGNYFSDYFTEPEKARDVYKKVLGEGFVRDYPLTIKHINGKTVDVMYNATVYRNEKGEFQGILAVARDISDIKKTEEELLNKCLELKEQADELHKTQDQMVRAERLAAIGQLASSVAHELRNPLGVMKNVIYYLKMMEIVKDNKEISDNLDMISSEIEHSNQIISDLLGFAKIKSSILINQNINLMILGVLKKMVKPPNVKIITKLDKNLPKISVDQLQLDQIFNNLSSNAIQAMDRGGTLTIETLMEDNCIKIIFADTGSGITKENMDKIFEPLFSTKACGTGLGLSIVKLLVEKHNGKIEVESETGKGARFIITLPTKIL